MPSPCSALIAIGSPRPSAIGLEHARLRRRGPRPCWRRPPPAWSRARSQRADFLVQRRHAFARIDHEQRDVGLAHRRLGLRAHPAGQCVRILILEARRCRSPGIRGRAGSPRPHAGRGSRPGRSSTSARRLPTSRLNSVDLPTLGRPTMATVGMGMSGAIAAPSQRREVLPERASAGRGRRECRASSWRRPATG